MAYKFQIGRARLSGSVIAEEGVLTDDGADITSDNDIYASVDIEAGNQLRALGDLYVATTSMQIGNAAFGADVAVTGAVSAAELSGALEYKLGAGNGITMTDWRNGADGTIALDASYAKGLLSADGDLVDYNSSTGAISTNASNFSASWDVKMAAADTDALAEGSTNLYYLDSRARAALSDADVIDYNSSTGVIGIDASAMTSSIEVAAQAYFSGGNMIDISAAGVVSVNAAEFSGSWDDVLATKDTDDLSEGSTNLYYTDARARAALSVTDAGGDGSLTYNNSTGVFTYTGPSASEVRAHLSVADTNSIDMSYSGGQFSADLILSGAASNDALEITADGLDLKDEIFGARTFRDAVTINGDLIVLGNTFSASVGTLLVEDALITIADGAAALANGQGFEVGANLASFKVRTGVTFDLAGEAAFNSSLPIQAPHMKADTFHGELVGTMKLDVVTKADADTDLDAGKVNKYEDLTAGDADSIALPSAASQGQVVYLKMGDVPDGAYLEVTATDIDGVSSIYLESPNAAVKFICNGSDNWMVF